MRPVLTKVSAEHHIQRDFVAKIEQELVVKTKSLRQGRFVGLGIIPSGWEQSSTRSPTKKFLILPEEWGVQFAWT